MLYANVIGVTDRMYPCLHYLFQSIIETARQKGIQDMLIELEVMKSMQPHPHVVRLIGCCTEKGTALIKTMNLQFLWLQFV